MKRIYCEQCKGYYKVREGKYDLFAGCSNYPVCKSTLKIPDFVLKYIQIYGINIYRWYRTCYKCGKETPVYSYYLNYDLADVDDFFDGYGEVGLGDLRHLDEFLSREIPTIKLQYSNTIKSKYMANTCEHCYALQGRNYVVDDPHEIIEELWHNHNMGKFFFMCLRVEDTAPIAKDIMHLYTFE